MKKAIAIVLVCMLAATMLAACGGSNTPANTANNNTTNNNAANNNAANNNANNNATNNNIANTDVPLTQNPPANNFDASRRIAVFTREDGSGTRDAFVSITGVGGDMTPEAVVESETNQILTKVEENEFAISYVSVGSLNPQVKALNIEGVSPSDATIMNGTYTLQRPLLVCVNADNQNNPLVQDFIQFMLSSAGQEQSSSRWTTINPNAPGYTPGGLSGTLKVGGSTSVEPLMQRMSEAYRALNPNVVIEISGGGSGTGISEATSGVLDIGMSSRALRDNEKEALAFWDIALDGVAVIVNPANPVTGMTIEQVRQIFTGEAERWSEVG